MRQHTIEVLHTVNTLDLMRASTNVWAVKQEWFELEFLVMPIKTRINSVRARYLSFKDAL